MARDGGYFGILFKGYHGVTQVDPLSPTIFNVVMDAVIRSWVAVVAPSEDGTEKLGVSIKDLEVYFYSNRGLVTSTQTDWLKRAFEVLVRLFN